MTVCWEIGAVCVSDLFGHTPLRHDTKWLYPVTVYWEIGAVSVSDLYWTHTGYDITRNGHGNHFLSWPIVSSSVCVVSNTCWIWTPGTDPKHVIFVSMYMTWHDVDEATQILTIFCVLVCFGVYVVYNTCTTQNYMDLAPTLGCPCFLAWLSIFEGINSMWILERLKDIMCWRNKGRANKCNKTRKEGKRSEAAYTEFLFMHPSQKLYMAIMLSGVFY